MPCRTRNIINEPLVHRDKINHVALISARGVGGKLEQEPYLRGGGTGLKTRKQIYNNSIFGLNQAHGIINMPNF